MREEQLPIENEDRASDSSWGEMQDSTSRNEAHALRSDADWQPKSAGFRALRSIAASLPSTRRVGLLRYEPGKGGRLATCTPVSAIQNDQGRWLPLAPLDLLDSQLLEKLAAVAPVNDPGSPTSPVLHLPGVVVAWCRNEQGRVQGALVAQPDIFRTGTAGTLRPTETLLNLLTTLTLMALELENSSLDLLRMTRIAAEEARARESFISFAAHELRSPLTSIRGFAQLLVRQSRKTSLPEPMLRSVQSIDQQSLRMSEMLGEMLDASRILHGALEMMPTPMDLAALVRKTVEHRRLLFPEHNFTVLGADVAIPGCWDGGRVEQIVRDLLDNAARYSRIGTAIVVTVTREPHKVVVSVRDQGSGIDEADRPHIFEYLYRTSDSVRRNLSGLGLGLYVSRYLAKSLGGDLWLESSSTAFPGGSDFRFTLPASQPDSAAMSEADDRVH